MGKSRAKGVIPTCSATAWAPGVLEGIQRITPEAFIGTPFHDAYVKAAARRAARLGPHQRDGARRVGSCR
jgi:hypothetical protein